MAKFEGHNRLHPDDRELIIQDFYSSFLEVKNEDELVSYLNDLLSEPELEMLARRVQIARMLKEGFTYEEIRNALYVSEGTVASTAQSLKRGEGGLALVAARLGKAEEEEEEEEEDIEGHLVGEDEEDEAGEEEEIVPVREKARARPLLNRLREEKSRPAPKALRHAVGAKSSKRLGWSR